MKDLPPLKALILLFRSLQFAQSETERHEIVRAARAVRHLLPTQHKTEGLSAHARLILSKCSGQTLHAKTIARVMGRSYEGTPFRQAMRQLRAGGYLEKTERGMYHISAEPVRPEQPGDVQPFTKAS